jgi:FKBP-type peptidyl-prolyl cis-trans isomerase 2
MKRYLHYAIMFEDEAVFDSSDHWGGPLACDEIGESFPEKVLEVIAKLRPGEEHELTLSIEEGYGERDEELVFSVDRDKLPDDLPLDEGSVFNITIEEGEELLCVVVAIDGATVTLDANHPLAGYVVKFWLRIEELS